MIRFAFLIAGNMIFCSSIARSAHTPSQCLTCLAMLLSDVEWSECQCNVAERHPLVQ